jgi:hypothetical protein
MPLRDHFHLPLRGLCTFESFHSGWSNEMVRQLNKMLPPEFVARPNVKLGVDVAADVGTPPTPTLSISVDFQHLDVFEVQVHREGGLELVAAIELVSPRNKDRPSSRRQFIAKCLAYLQTGVSIVLVDVVTARRENLYDLMLNIWSYPRNGLPLPSMRPLAEPCPSRHRPSWRLGFYPLPWARRCQPCHCGSTPTSRSHWIWKKATRRHLPNYVFQSEIRIRIWRKPR